MNHLNSAHQAKAGRYLTFVLKGRPYGLPIDTVRGINQVNEITPVPQTPEFVIGVINLRGKVIPVVDLRLKFGLEYTPYNRETCIIVIEGEHGQIGMVVDQVSEVVDFIEENIEASPQMGEKMNFVLGMGKVDERVIILIDIVSALSKEAMLGQKLIAGAQL